MTCLFRYPCINDQWYSSGVHQKTVGILHILTIGNTRDKTPLMTIYIIIIIIIRHLKIVYLLNPRTPFLPSVMHRSWITLPFFPPLLLLVRLHLVPLVAVRLKMNFELGYFGGMKKDVWCVKPSRSRQHTLCRSKMNEQQRE